MILIPNLWNGDQDEIIERATIAKEGSLTPKFAYLQGYLEGE